MSQLNDEQQQEIWEMKESGLSVKKISEQTGCSWQACKNAIIKKDKESEQLCADAITDDGRPIVVKFKIAAYRNLMMKIHKGDPSSIRMVIGDDLKRELKEFNEAKKKSKPSWLTDG